MTTIAYDGRMLACDTLATSTSTGDYSYVDTKIFAVNDFLIGFAGAPGQLKPFLRRCKSKRLIDVLYEGYSEYVSNENDPHILLIDTNTGIPYLQEYGHFVKENRTLQAIGSGGMYALGAMATGLTANEAIVVAARFDRYTGGEICCIRVDPQLESEELV